MTFVENLLRTKGLEITDINGKPIFGPGEEIDLKLNKPAVIENLDLIKALFHRSNREVKFLSHEELRNFGWFIYQRPIRTETYDYSMFFPSHQKVFYFVLEETKNIPTQSIRLESMPRDLFIRYVIKTKLFRLEGKNAGRNGIGPWRPLDMDTRRLVNERQKRRKIKNA